jgi:hypothetical protein
VAGLLDEVGLDLAGHALQFICQLSSVFVFANYCIIKPMARTLHLVWNSNINQL